MDYFKEPGYIYDLLTIFKYHFSREAYIKVLSENEKMKLDEIYMQTISKNNISDDLLPFFYPKNKIGLCFISVYFCSNLYQYKEIDTRSFIKSCLQDKSIIEKLLDYYIDDGDEYDYKNISIHELSRIIDKPNLPDKVKFRLLSFLTNPNYYLQKLAAELTEKQEYIENYYKENSENILLFDKKVNLKESISKLQEYSGIDLINNDSLNYSVTLLQREFLYDCQHESNNLLLIGIDTIEYIENHPKENVKFNLNNLGRIISDEIRTNILEILHDKGEISTGEFSRLLNMKMTSIFYHLNMMYSEDLLSIRNEGRKVYYKINKDYFRKAIEALDKYTK